MKIRVARQRAGRRRSQTISIKNREETQEMEGNVTRTGRRAVCIGFHGFRR
jgi:hypothetical protein